MGDDRVAVDEARRDAQYASVKHQIEGNVNAELKGRAGSATLEQTERVGHVAAEMRDRVLHETVASQHAVARSRGAARTSQFIDFAFYLVYGLLAIRLVLSLIDARYASGFVQFIYGVTYPLYLPFRGIVASPTSEEGFTLALPVLIAIGAYLLLHVAINGMLRMTAHRKTTI